MIRFFWIHFNTVKLLVEQVKFCLVKSVMYLAIFIINLGRRGYDTIGTAVFFDIPFSKVKRLVSSYLPEIRPHFPLSITFCLQLFDLAFKRNSHINMSVDCVLKKSFWNFSYPSKVSQVHYDAIFSLNFLMDLQLLNSNGKFSLFTDLIERISYHEPSNFILYNLFIHGVFHEMVQHNQDNITNQIMLVMCHLFNREPLRNENATELPCLTEEVKSNINKFNKFVLTSYTNFFISLCKKIRETTKNDLNMLPLSKVSFSKKEVTYLNRFIGKWNYEYSLVSPFSALSGILDDNVLHMNNQLFFNCLSLLHIDSKILPLFHNEDLLNDYAYKFFRNEASDWKFIKEIIANCITLGDLMNLLKDFKTVLNSITFFLNKISPQDDKIKQAFEKISDQFNGKFSYLTENMYDILCSLEDSNDANLDDSVQKKTSKSDKKFKQEANKEAAFKQTEKTKKKQNKNFEICILCAKELKDNKQKKNRRTSCFKCAKWICYDCLPKRFKQASNQLYECDECSLVTENILPKINDSTN